MNEAEVDRRWLNVEGGIKRHDIDPPGTKRLVVEVVGPTGHRVGHAFILDDEARTLAVTDPLPMVLDRVVREIDKALHS